ncbi:unnamed protein product [Prorocentrum cordatum]|uniref:Digeranylgeranylglycerophospholipid reductase catalytic domain-containing protein n=2 Tax=Prorocentrum cordatum TaxID=2364126 RepID=A0ABN9Y7Y6_9DINO|nr:unnamed protein product [Polarella glacialis]
MAAFAVAGAAQPLTAGSAPAAQPAQALRAASLRGSPAPAAEASPWLLATAAAGAAAVGAAAAAAPRRRARAAPLAGASRARVTPVASQGQQRTLRGARVVVCAGAKLPEGRKLRVAVIGGGPGGASCAVTTYLIERKLDNCKPCGGAIPLCMVEEFNLPPQLVDRCVRKMTMISPSNREVQIGQTLKDDEYIGMVRREVLDKHLRDTAAEKGATVINGLFMGMDMPQSDGDPYVLSYNDLGDQTGEIEADNEYAIAFQERMTIDEKKMEYYKYDHVAVGTGTVIDKKGIQKYQQGIRDRAAPRIEGGALHPDGDAAGYVTKCSGEGIYFAGKSGFMCAEEVVRASENGTRMIDENDLKVYIRKFDEQYGPTYIVLDALQKVFYTSDAARESFVELCEEEYVQKVTFDSYLYKTVQGNNPMGDLKLGWKTLTSLWNYNKNPPPPMKKLEAHVSATGSAPAAQPAQALRAASLRGSPAPAAEASPWLLATAAAGAAAVGAAAAAAPRRRARAAPLAGASRARVTPVASQGQQRTLRGARVVVCAGAKLPEGRKLRVAVIGGGPGGASCAVKLAEGGVETYLIERKLDNCKPCGGAIPLCMVEEFNLPPQLVDRCVRKMTMISPSNREVQIGQTLKDDEYIGMVRREVLDKHLRDTAAEKGATVINGLFMGMDMPQSDGDPYVLSYNDLGDQTGAARKGVKKTLEVDVVIGADGANSRVAKEIEAGDYEYAIAFQERMTIDEKKMEYYKERAEMYVGEDVSPDFYAWVFPKYDHVAVGTGTVIDKKGIQKYQQGIRDRAAPRIEGGEIIRVEAHPIPEHPRPWRTKGRCTLIGDAAGYVTKCSGEGIYFAGKSGFMCAEEVVRASENGTRMIDENDLKVYIRKFDEQYGPTYIVLDALQKVFYTSDAARESFVELCEEEYVQKVTFDSYLYKTVQGNDPMGDLKLGWKTLTSLWNYNKNPPPPMKKLEVA